MPEPKRPYVICHMVPSVDGRIVTERWSLGARLTKEYERAGNSFDADAWIIGRVSMEPYAGKAKIPTGRVKPVPRKDFIAQRDVEAGYAIALDPSGKLTWRSGSIDDEHVVTVLTEQVSDAYLTHLRAKKVSYLFGGKTSLDLPRVLAKLRKEFRIETLLLEGGGGINGTFLDAGLVDELSLLVVPVADGATGIPTLFDVKRSSKSRTPAAHPLKLLSITRRPGDILWIRYAVKNGRERTPSRSGRGPRGARA